MMQCGCCRKEGCGLSKNVCDSNEVSAHSLLYCSKERDAEIWGKLVCGVCVLANLRAGLKVLFAVHGVRVCMLISARKVACVLQRS